MPGGWVGLEIGNGDREKDAGRDSEIGTEGRTDTGSRHIVDGTFEGTKIGLAGEARNRSYAPWRCASG